MSFKVYIWSFADGKNLIGVAFVDTQLLVHTMSTSGDYIIVGDIQKSIALLRFDVSNFPVPCRGCVVLRIIRRCELYGGRPVLQGVIKSIGLARSEIMRYLWWHETRLICIICLPLSTVHCPLSTGIYQFPGRAIQN